MNHKDEMFTYYGESLLGLLAKISYYGQRKKYAYPRTAVVLDAKKKNMEISHINLDLGIFMKNYRVCKAWI